MEEKQFYKLLEGIQRIETSQAVLKEKLTQMDQRLDSTNKRVDAADEEFDEIKNRVARLEKIAAAIAMAGAIVSTLFKLRII
jgi:archaellum component FlaC